MNLATVAQIQRKDWRTIFEKFTLEVIQICRISSKTLHLCGVTVISRRAWIRLSSGGWVLKRDDTAPPPNNGFTMHSADVDRSEERRVGKECRSRRSTPPCSKDAP